MTSDLTTSVRLTLRKTSAVLHALERLGEAKKCEIADLLKCLRTMIAKEKVDLYFSEKEIHYIIDALKLALQETKISRAERYGFLSIADLENLLKEFEVLSQRF